MRVIRFRALKTFLITSKNLRRSLVAINIGIFLAIFAASSAVISLFVENELTDYEFSNIELRSTSFFSPKVDSASVFDPWYKGKSSKKNTTGTLRKLASCIILKELIPLVPFSYF